MSLFLQVSKKNYFSSLLKEIFIMNDWYSEFWKENKKIIICHVFITIIIIPLEIIIFSVFTKKLFQALQKNNFKVFVKLFVVFIVLLSLLQIIYGWKEYIDNKITPRVQSFIRNRYMSRYMSMTTDSFNNSDIMTQISTMPKNFYSNYEAVIKFWIPLFTCFVFYLVFLYWNDIKIGMISTVVFGVLLTTFVITFKSLTIYSNRVFSNQSHLVSEYENILQNNETIQSYNSYEDELQFLQNREKFYEKERVRLIFYIDVAKFSFTIILFVYLLSVFFYFYSLMMEDKKLYPPWKFITFITILFFVVRFVLCLMTYYQKTIQVNGTIQELSKIPLGVEDLNPLHKIEFKTYNIDMKNVTFSYPNNPDNIVLKNFNLNIPYRSNILIKGKIGSGKSTIGRLLCGWYKTNQGEITIDNKIINTISHRDLKSIIFMISQNTILFSDKTVFENICYQFKKMPPKNILDKYYLPKHFKDLLDKKITHNGKNISGGQKRMVHILRAILHSAPIVILDEPTDSLDDTITKNVKDLIIELKKTKTVICISHDERLHDIFDRIFKI